MLIFKKPTHKIIAAAIEDHLSHPEEVRDKSVTKRPW